jgi:hypothetical protein
MHRRYGIAIAVTPPPSIYNRPQRAARGCASMQFVEKKAHPSKTTTRLSTNQGKTMVYLNKFNNKINQSSGLCH